MASACPQCTSEGKEAIFETAEEYNEHMQSHYAGPSAEQGKMEASTDGPWPAVPVREPSAGAPTWEDILATIAQIAALVAAVLKQMGPMTGAVTAPGRVALQSNVYGTREQWDELQSAVAKLAVLQTAATDDIASLRSDVSALTARVAGLVVSTAGAGEDVNIPTGSE